MAPSRAFFILAIGFMAGAAVASVAQFVAALLLTVLGITAFLAWRVATERGVGAAPLLFITAMICGLVYSYAYAAYGGLIAKLFDAAFFKSISDALANFKYHIEGNIEKVLTKEKAAFMNGLLLGERQKFSPEFQEALKLSGTTHLVALSGYNIAIIIWAFSSLLRRFLKRNVVMVVTVIGIMAFVVMTGAAASVVRAALMAGIILLAERSGRPYHARNALVAAALLMTLADPRVIVFDWGFQLSFAAVLGLMYVKPILEKRFGGEAGLLGWRENLITSVSAQAAALPILIWHFGFVSPFSLFANVLILEFIPITMLLGFLVAAAGFLSYGLSLVFGWCASLLLGYEMWIIAFFANVTKLL